jgi:hypothetical protein
VAANLHHALVLKSKLFYMPIYHKYPKKKKEKKKKEDNCTVDPCGMP